MIFGISEIGDLCFVIVVTVGDQVWEGGFGGGDWCLAVVWDCGGDNGGGGEVGGTDGL